MNQSERTKQVQSAIFYINGGIDKLRKSNKIDKLRKSNKKMAKDKLKKLLEKAKVDLMNTAIEKFGVSIDTIKMIIKD